MTTKMKNWPVEPTIVESAEAEAGLRRRRKTEEIQYSKCDSFVGTKN